MFLYQLARARPHNVLHFLVLRAIHDSRLSHHKILIVAFLLGGGAEEHGYTENSILLNSSLYKSFNDTINGKFSFVPRPRPAFHHFQYGKAGEGLVSFLM